MFRNRVTARTQILIANINHHRKAATSSARMRGALHARKRRSRTSESVLAEARQMADLGYTEINCWVKNVNSYKDSSPDAAVRNRLRMLASSR